MKTIKLLKWYLFKTQKWQFYLKTKILLWQKCENDIKPFWCQQDGATPHLAHLLLQSIFWNHCSLFDLYQNVASAFNSKHRLDFYFWGYLVAKTYINKPKPLLKLKANIRREVAILPAEILADVMGIFLKNEDIMQFELRTPFARWYHQSGEIKCRRTKVNDFWQLKIRFSWFFFRK